MWVSNDYRKENFHNCYRLFEQSSEELENWHDSQTWYFSRLTKTFSTEVAKRCISEPLKSNNFHQISHLLHFSPCLSLYNNSPNWNLLYTPHKDGWKSASRVSHEVCVVAALRSGLWLQVQAKIDWTAFVPLLCVWYLFPAVLDRAGTKGETEWKKVRFWRMNRAGWRGAQKRD